MTFPISGLIWVLRHVRENITQFLISIFGAGRSFSYYSLSARQHIDITFLIILYVLKVKEVSHK